MTTDDPPHPTGDALLDALEAAASVAIEECSDYEHLGAALSTVEDLADRLIAQRTALEADMRVEHGGIKVGRLRLLGTGPLGAPGELGS